MKKLTSKSASASRKTSSRSGESAKMAITAKTPSRLANVNVMYFKAVDKVRAMSTADFRHALVRLGINKPNGQLTAKYSNGKKKTLRGRTRPARKVAYTHPSV
jgi:hypothetical protein